MAGPVGLVYLYPVAGKKIADALDNVGKDGTALKHLSLGPAVTLAGPLPLSSAPFQVRPCFGGTAVEIFAQRPASVAHEAGECAAGRTPGQVPGATARAANVGQIGEMAFVATPQGPFAAKPAFFLRVGPSGGCSGTGPSRRRHPKYLNLIFSNFS